MHATRKQINMNFQTQLLLAILSCWLLLLPSEAAVAKGNRRTMDDATQAKLASFQKHRHQRFNEAADGDKTPLDSLFTMSTERRDDLQTHVTDMMKHARLHAEAKRKVEEQLNALHDRGTRTGTGFASKS